MSWMTRMAVSLVLLASLFSVAFSCKCLPQSTKDAFCAAQWVSHVNLKLRATKQPVPANPERRGLNNIRYVVEHVKTFKKPDNMTSLPNEIYTPSETPACGLIMDVGKQYLLAGRVVPGGNLFTVICGQVLPDDSSKPIFEHVLEWNAVPANMTEQLGKIKC